MDNLAEDCSLSSYPSEAVNRWQPFWKPKDSQPEIKARVVAGAPAPASSCEFTGDIPFVGCASKLRLRQIDGCICTFACYSDSKVWSKCWTRLEKLKNKGKT